MKYILFFIFITFTSTTAYAEWISVSETSDQTSYIKKGSIKKDGHIVQFWEMRNFKTEKYGGLSSKILLKIDCEKNKTQSVEAYLFLDKDGTGSVLKSKKQLGEWENIVPDSSYDIFKELVCS